MSLWQWVGVALVVWLLWDLYAGTTWIHRTVYREYEPSLYWVVMSVWAVIAGVLVLGIW